MPVSPVRREREAGGAGEERAPVLQARPSVTAINIMTNVTTSTNIIVITTINIVITTVSFRNFMFVFAA